MATRYDERGNPIPDAAGPKPRYDESGNPITASQAAAAPAAQPSLYSRLTNPDDPGARAFAERTEQTAKGTPYEGLAKVGGVVARGLSAVGGGVASAPAAAYQTIRHPIDTAKQFNQAVKDWENPATRPSFAGAMSVLPEALGGATGQVGLGEILSHPTVKPHIDTVSKILERQPAINEGQVKLANSARTAALQLENAVTGKDGEVGKHAQAVIAADKMDLARTQSEGKVNGMEATMAGQTVLDKTKLGGVAHGFKAQMGMDEAKAAMTQLGREGARLERTGKAPEAAAVWAEYDALRKATMDRANQLGPDYGKSWGHYSDEFHKFTKLRGKPFGDILEGGDEVGVLKSLFNPDNAAHFFNSAKDSGSVLDWMKKYKVDPAPLKQAATQGKLLNDLTQLSSATVMGKIKLLSRHAMLGIPVLAATHAAASAAGLGGGLGGLVISLIVASKVAGVLDRRQIKSLLKDINKRIPPEAGQVTPPGAGPQPLPQPPSGGNVTLAPAGGAVGTGPLEETPKPSPQEVEDIRAESGLPLGEEGVQQRITGRSDLAEKLKGARGSRRSSGVYKGSRGGGKPVPSSADVTYAPDAPNPTPQTRALVGRGAHGQVVVEFPDAFHKDLFSEYGRSAKQMRGEEGPKPQIEYIAKKLGISKTEAWDKAKEYRATVMKAIKDKEEGTTYVAPKLGEEP